MESTSRSRSSIDIGATVAKHSGIVPQFIVAHAVSGCDTVGCYHGIGTNNADKEGTTTIVDKYRKLLKKTKEARVEQIILSGILPVFGNRIDGYRNSKRMAINGMVKRLCKEEDVGYVDLWDSVLGKEGMYARDGLHLSGKGAAVFAEGLSGAVASGLGKVRYLN